MRRDNRWSGFAFAALLVAGGASAEAQSTAPKVVATIKPVHALVAQVMGETGAPALIVSGAASLHSYALKPSDARLLADADIVIRVSAGFEPFLAKTLKTLNKTTTIVSLLDAPGVTALTLRQDPNFEKHGHAKAEKKGHSHDHGDGSGGTTVDGHIWLDPTNAAAMVDQIAVALIARDPARGDAYRANAAKAKVGIAALAQELDAGLKPLAGQPYIVLHDAYQYLERRYGLTPVGAITTSPEVPPSGKRLAALREKIRTLGAACIFSEPNFESKVVQSVAEGSRARTAQLDPEAITLAAGPDLYSALVRKMASSMRGCLLPSS